MTVTHFENEEFYGYFTRIEGPRGTILLWREKAEVTDNDKQLANDLSQVLLEIRCSYCGNLGWTVEKHGRITHKEACPHRTDPWSQLEPKREVEEK